MANNNPPKNGWYKTVRKDSNTDKDRPIYIMYQNGKEISHRWADLDKNRLTRKIFEEVKERELINEEQIEDENIKEPQSLSDLAKLLDNHMDVAEDIYKGLDIIFHNPELKEHFNDEQIQELGEFMVQDAETMSDYDKKLKELYTEFGFESKYEPEEPEPEDTDED